MSRSCGNIGDEIFGDYFSSVLSRKKGEQVRGQVGSAGVPIAPKGEDTATERTFVMIKVRNRSTESKGRSGGRRCSRERRQINLPVGDRPPEFCVRLCDDSAVRNDPLTI